MMMFTLLTDPVPCGHYLYTETPKMWVRGIKRILFPLPAYRLSQYRGHHAVTRSAVEGMRKAGINVNYNPRSIAEVGNYVVVLSGISALKQAIAWKRAGRIKRLLAGPNLVTDPREHNSLICAPEIDAYLVNSDWTQDFYLRACPDLSERCKIWPAGVDVDYWVNERHTKVGQKILIYQKNGPDDLVEFCVDMLQQQDYEIEVIKYGQYEPSGFLKVLKSSQLMIAFSQSESQGLALAEAWSVGVPTLVWNKGWINLNGERISASSAPFLSDETGLFFSGIEDFCIVFEQWKKLRDQYHTRHWVLENMSDEVCARKLAAF